MLESNVYRIIDRVTIVMMYENRNHRVNRKRGQDLGRLVMKEI